MLHLNLKALPILLFSTGWPGSVLSWPLYIRILLSIVRSFLPRSGYIRCILVRKEPIRCRCLVRLSCPEDSRNLANAVLCERSRNSCFCHFLLFAVILILVSFYVFIEFCCVIWLTWNLRSLRNPLLPSWFIAVNSTVCCNPLQENYFTVIAKRNLWMND